MQAPKPQEYITEREAIDYVPFGERVFRQMVEDGTIPFYQFGKARRHYLKSDIDEALQRRRRLWGASGKSGSGGDPAQKSTNTTSRSNVLDFEEVVARSENQTPRP